MIARALEFVRHGNEFVLPADAAHDAPVLEAIRDHGAQKRCQHRIVNETGVAALQGLEAPIAPAGPAVRPAGDNYYAYGLMVGRGWIVQIPSFSGYAATMAYFPARKLAIAI
jgi:hypothetical protein